MCEPVSAIFTAVYLARPVAPPMHDSGHGHLTVWGVVLGVIFLIAVLTWQFLRRRSRR